MERGEGNWESGKRWGGNKEVKRHDKREGGGQKEGRREEMAEELGRKDEEEKEIR